MVDIRPEALPRLWPSGLLVFVVALAAFAPSIGYDWVGWDDEAYVTVSPLMTAPDGLRLIWASTEADQYYPLAFTFLRIQYQLFERDPTGYHVTCVLLHAVNAVVLLWTLHSSGLTRGVAVATALLFAVHPVQVMSVAWVAQQKNLLSCLFVLLSISAWLRLRRNGHEGWYAASLVAFAAALMSKTAVLTLPLAIIALDTIVLQRRALSALVRALPMFMLAVLALALTIVFEKPFVEGESIPPFVQRIFIAGAAVWFYVFALLYPAGLLPIYPLWPVSAGNWRWWLPLLSLIVAIVILWRLRHRMNRHAWYGLVFFLVFLLPMLGFVPFGNLGVTYVSDHYLYVAGIGLMLSVVIAGGSILERRKHPRPVRRGVTSAMLVTLIALTYRYQPTFFNAASMWTRTLSGHPDCFTAHAGLGQFHANQKDWTAAISSYEKARAWRPDHIGVRQALARAQFHAGRLSDAEKTLQAIVQADATLPEPFLHLAQIAERTGRYDEAISSYHRALNLDSHQASTRIRLGQLLLGLARIAEAEAQFDLAVRDAPDEPWGYLGSATCRRGAGRSDEAVSLLQRGRERAPDNVALMNLLARILATDPDDEIRDGPRAVRLAMRAEQLTGSSDCLVMDTLAAAYAETGDFPRAVATAARAAALAASQGFTTTAEQLRNVIDHYRNGNVVRETKTNLTLR